MASARMHAVVQQAFGGPEVLRFAEVDRPEPGSGEVLVRVEAVGVNPADWKIREGLVRRFGEPPFVPGLDLAGVVVGSESSVEGFGPGDRVFGTVFPPHGACAEYVVVPAGALALAPREVDVQHAAALPIAALTAWQALVRAAGVTAGQRVLIHAAAGGVGHLAVQIAKARGAFVIGTAGAANQAFLGDLGADEVVDYTACGLPSSTCCRCVALARRRRSCEPATVGARPSWSPAPGRGDRWGPQPGTRGDAPGGVSRNRSRRNGGQALLGPCGRGMTMLLNAMVNAFRKQIGSAC
jgi:D-arabinose 1-dehydrogenase-like Zn-dependent alcohol dehydrogenase